MSVNKNKTKLSLHFRTDDNKVKLSKSNTFIHELLKSAVCKILKDNKHCFVTEGRFTSMDRADVYDLTEDIVYEIVCSESEESIKNKMLRYPVREIIVIDVKDYQNSPVKELEQSLLKTLKKYL